jgi:hypothetical protein
MQSKVLLGSFCQSTHLNSNALIIKGFGQAFKMLAAPVLTHSKNNGYEITWKIHIILKFQMLNTNTLQLFTINILSEVIYSRC